MPRLTKLVSLSREDFETIDINVIKYYSPRKKPLGLKRVCVDALIGKVINEIEQKIPILLRLKISSMVTKISNSHNRMARIEIEKVIKDNLLDDEE